MSYDQCKEEVIAVNDLEFTKYHEARRRGDHRQIHISLESEELKGKRSSLVIVVSEEFMTTISLEDITSVASRIQTPSFRVLN